MKANFEFEETVKYTHNIEVEIPEDTEEGFEDIAQEVAKEIEGNSENYDRHDVVSKFTRIYGDNNVNFKEDSSPDVEYECL